MLEEYILKPASGAMIAALPAVVAAVTKSPDWPVALVGSVVCILTALLLYYVLVRRLRVALGWSYWGLAVCASILPTVAPLRGIAPTFGVMAGLVVIALSASLVSTTHPDEFGFAATGVVYVELSIGKAFVLVLNENLRSGRGLWVPPGGHFNPADDDPTDRLVRKIWTEVALDASVDSSNITLTLPQYSTSAAIWWVTPSFVLNEDLFGNCSMGHRRHIDLIYIVKGTEVPHPDARPKYPESRRLYVPIAQCSSESGAYSAILSALQEWEVQQRGRASGLVDTVTRDVAHRLFLAARILNPTHSVSAPTREEA